MNCQSRFNAWYWMLGAGTLGWPRGMVRGGRWEGGFRMGTHVHPWRIHVDMWQNQHNIVKLKNKIKINKFIFWSLHVQLWSFHVYLHSVFLWASLVAQLVKNPPIIWETWIRSLCREDPLEKGSATHSSTVAWKIPWMEKPDRLCIYMEFTKMVIITLYAR